MENFSLYILNAKYECYFVVLTLIIIVLFLKIYNMNCAVNLLCLSFKDVNSVCHKLARDLFQIGKILKPTYYLDPQ